MDHNNENSKPKYRNKVMTGAFWNVLQVFVQGGFKFVIRLVLARLLVPEAFGLVGITVVFTGLVQTINELGLSAALLQRKESELAEEHYTTGFWVSLIFSAILFVIMCLIVAPLAANFYEAPLLRQLIPVMSIPMLLKPLTLTQRVKLARDINFKPLVIIQGIGIIIAGCLSLVMAYAGWGVWSIALQGVITSLITIPLMWYVYPWKPKASISLQAFMDIFNYGIFVFFKKMIVYFTANVDYLIIGKLAGSYYVGIYTLAFTLTDIFRKQLMSVLNKVMFPVYAKMQEDPAMAGDYYLKIVRYNTVIIFPIMAGLFSYADSFIRLVFKEQWIESIVPLKFLAIAVIFHVASGSLSTVLTGIGKVRTDFTVYLLKTFVITVPMLVLLINAYGINGAAAAILITKIISFLINMKLASRYLLICYKTMLKTVMPASLGAVGIIVVSNLMMSLFWVPDSLLMLFVFSVLSASLYLLIVYPFLNDELREVAQDLLSRRR